MVEVCASTWLRMLTDEHDEGMRAHPLIFLYSCDVGGEGFLSYIDVRDEAWVHHYEPESKSRSMEWRHMTSPGKKCALGILGWESCSSCKRGTEADSIEIWPLYWSSPSSSSSQKKCFRSVALPWPWQATHTSVHTTQSQNLCALYYRNVPAVLTSLQWDFHQFGPFIPRVWGHS